MLTILLLLWLRKVLNNRRSIHLNHAFQPSKFGSSMLLVLFGLPVFAIAQVRTYSYHVARNNETIGRINITESTAEEIKSIRLESEIKAKMIFSIRVSSKETTILNGNRIVSAQSIRKVNGNKEVAKSLQSMGSGYRMVSDNRNIDFRNMVLFNTTVSLYVTEPVHSLLVFSDAFNKVLTLKKTGEHEYLLEMPDGNRNIYKYRNGVCHEILVDHTFFTATILLDKIAEQ